MKSETGSGTIESHYIEFEKRYPSKFYSTNDHKMFRVSIFLGPYNRASSEK